MANLLLGNIFIVAAPSGGGKTSLVKHLISSLEDIEVSISHTTRAKRPGEKEGVDYFFVDEKRFLEMVNDNDFVEHAQVFNHYYGTSVAQINARLSAGIDVVLDIDWQGAQQIRRIFPQAISIFVVPPSLDVLKQRLQERKQDKEDVIADRMHRAQDELSHFSEFDYLIVNDEFEKAASDLQAIVKANRLTLQRQSAKVGKLLSFLLS
ncbi:guanylate kinase [Legionella taurinensis]|uniref:Guanylate kinase n=1 Tax=Legionella taurinensis TaxID=70611 RepID=A0A3A5LB36_9GAMM|nr:guanylate kinase [Legionella taurinensis]MDX1836417.1 guanylate kinase [Legionella taurinensis]PUT43111.1 guanylate kinase [Legionella taurinensis]PUT45072.1 guanylate kinase [Legionella taurinensis]PUT45666.1 guanylate kinase [Legionella taurinensis]PUT49435.1 guanylate kinase [Legionella taurinensis]